MLRNLEELLSEPSVILEADRSQIPTASSMDSTMYILVVNRSHKIYGLFYIPKVLRF